MDNFAIYLQRKNKIICVKKTKINKNLKQLQEGNVASFERYFRKWKKMWRCKMNECHLRINFRNTIFFLHVKSNTHF